jgi:hypothetical protein
MASPLPTSYKMRREFKRMQNIPRPPRDTRVAIYSNQERLVIIAVLVPMTARQYSVPDVLCPVIMKDINTL